MGDVELSGWGCVALALLLLVLPLPWVAAALLAGAFHECCHYLVIRALGGRVPGVTVGYRGAVMELCGLGTGAELLAAAAGPVGSLSLLFLSGVFPRLALCGLVQGIYNLLPIYPLDGGRILRCTLKAILPAKTTTAISHWVGLAAALAVGGICIALGLYFGAAAVGLTWLRGERTENFLANGERSEYNRRARYAKR